MSVQPAHQTHSHQLSHLRSTPHTDGARATNGDQARASGSDPSAKGGGKSSFCCGKGCCSGGRSQMARGALNIDPSLLQVQMQQRAQETSATNATSAA